MTILFPIRSELLPLAIGFLIYMVLIPFAEASEQTVIQKVVPFAEQGRVFGFAQTLETAASPITAFLIGPIAQFWIIPSMTDGWLAATIGPWFGTGPERAMALIFIVVGVIGLVVTLLALRSRYYRELSDRYGAPPDDDQSARVAGGRRLKCRVPRSVRRRLIVATRSWERQERRTRPCNGSTTATTTTWW